ncbi:hypothetical protein [Bacillus toyonensis]|uniref:hypothetical protein n=1 Tax=Bacillus toyonensis TaxID=155322 RepID=UPI000BF57356|nr:hypothetical protein [Bacillus toyonensis]PGB42846.1 hypothetical protein COM02_24410 [Bacillus toyonensis]
MNKKIIEELMEEVIEETKEEIKEQVKENVKKKVLEEISKEISKDITEEEIKINTLKQFFAGLLAVILYTLISVVYLKTMEYSFNKIQNIDMFSDTIKSIVYCIVLIVLACLYLTVAHTLYRLKQNKSTVFLYGLFEIALGVVTLVVTGLTFLDEPSKEYNEVFGIKPVTFLAVYGSMYIVVRGMETAKKRFGEGEIAKVGLINLDKETRFSKFLDGWLRTK